MTTIALEHSTAEFIGHFAPGSNEWHAARAQGLGGSEIAAVLGLSPWESRFSLWHRKAGLAGPVIATDEMEWGHFMEAPIADWFAEQHPESSVVTTGTWRNRARPWQIANPDRFALADGNTRVVEIKNSGDADEWGQPGSDEIPIYYRTQVQWYLDTLGLQTAHLAVSIFGRPPTEYVIEYDPDDAVLMRTAAVEFLQSLAAGERPDIDAHTATYQVIRDAHPDIDDERVDIPADIATAYLEANASHKAAEAEKRRATSVLADHMGRGRRAMFDGSQIAMRIPGRNGAAPTVRAEPIKNHTQKVSAA